MRRRHSKNRQAKEPWVGGQIQQRIVTKEISDRGADERQSRSAGPHMIAFYEVEQRASERLQGVVRMIDELLKV
jgi:hypothetical protein